MVGRSLCMHDLWCEYLLDSQYTIFTQFPVLVVPSVDWSIRTSPIQRSRFSTSPSSHPRPTQLLQHLIQRTISLNVCPLSAKSSKCLCWLVTDAMLSSPAVWRDLQERVIAATGFTILAPIHDDARDQVGSPGCLLGPLLLRKSMRQIHCYRYSMPLPALLQV